jgi:predicted amidohydrolase YtcJ
MEADLILYNGRIHRMTPQNSDSTALAIKDGKFVAVGSDADTMQWAGNGTTKIDLKKKRVVPGLNDSHIHLIRGV